MIIVCLGFLMLSYCGWKILCVFVILGCVVTCLWFGFVIFWVCWFVCLFGCWFAVLLVDLLVWVFYLGVAFVFIWAAFRCFLV